MSRLLNRQKQLAEAGRLRLGYTTPTGSNGKVRPVRSETWILSSHAVEIVEAAAEMWGGTVEVWQPLGNGATQHRVITEATAIPAILPTGDPLTQAYETWSRGGAQRRCDGGTEQFSGSPCLCIAEFGDAWYEQPKGRVCDTKTRLKVLLPDMPGLGSYRVETGSFYAADEIAGMVDFIRSAVGDNQLVPVQLRIEPRTRVAGGQTKQFVVPVVELRGVTTGQVLAGIDPMAQITGRPSAPVQQIEASKVDHQDGLDVWAEVQQCLTGEDLTALWRHLIADPPAGLDAEQVKGWMKARADEIDAARSTAPAEPANAAPDPAAAVPADIDAAWDACVLAAGRLDPPWTLSEVESGFVGRYDKPSNESTYGDMISYRDYLVAGAK